jgi:hypothetical protein
MLEWWILITCVCLLQKSVQPLPIPGTSAEQYSIVAAASTEPHSDLRTPPDAITLATSAEGKRKANNNAAVKIPSLHSSILSPRMISVSSSSRLSSTSASSSHWSPGKSSDPYLYSISSQPYVYSSVKPYLSTSFQTSAERGGPGRKKDKLDSRNAMDQDDDDDDDDDVFANNSRGLGLLSTGEPSPPRLRRSNDMDREDGDAAGVFSFSSPCFGPRSLEPSDIPPLSPPPSEASKGSQGVMSPSWTAATLGKLSLNGTSADNSSTTAQRPQFGYSHRQSSSHIPSMPSRSLPSGAGNAMAGRKLSFHRRPVAHNAPKSYHLTGNMASGGSGGSASTMLHPHSHFQRSSSDIRSRSRSRSRGRIPDQAIPPDNRSLTEVDDDETDEEAMVMDGEDDDATEDESDQRNHRFKSTQTATPSTMRHHNKSYEDAYPQGRSIGTSVPLLRHPGGQATTMSASYERANSGLSRQFGSSDRYGASPASHYALSRHHPYAIGSTGASPSNAGILSSYSPSSARIGMGRRESNYGNSGGGQSGSPMASSQQTQQQGSHVMAHQLSHSPRYGAARQSGYYDQQQQYHSSHPTSLSLPAGQSTGLPYGKSPENSTVRRTPYAHTSGLNRQQGQGEIREPGGGREENEGEEEEEEEDEEEEEEDDDGEGSGAVAEEEEEEERQASRMKSTRKASSRQPRSTSHSRQAAPQSSNSGEVESSEMNEVSAIRERLGGAANCSAFISKLWYLMCRPELYVKYIHWSESGDSVILSNDPDVNNEFASEVLPKLFKHGNNASFVRQLNLYGFQRVPSSRLLDAAETKAARQFSNGSNISTALQLYGPHSSFAHPRVKKDQEGLLPSMKPRSSKKTKKGGQGGGAQSDGEEEYAN